MEKAESLKRKVKGAMVYPVVVVLVAVSILTFIMIKIVPTFETIFADFETELPPMTQMLITISNLAVGYWYLFPGIPLSIYIFVMVLKKFQAGRMGWDLFSLNWPVFGTLIKRLQKDVSVDPTKTKGTHAGPQGCTLVRWFPLTVLQGDFKWRLVEMDNRVQYAHIQGTWNLTVTHHHQYLNDPGNPGCRL